jgi:hypothetical protein
MKKKIWGTAVWYFFHTLAYKLKNEYEDQLTELFDIFVLVCNNLPCPICKIESTTMLKNVNKNDVTISKERFQYFLFNIHNAINSKLKTTIFTKEEYFIKYSKSKTHNIIIYFFDIMKNTGMKNENLIIRTSVNSYLDIIYKYIKQNINKYDK